MPDHSQRSDSRSSSTESGESGGHTVAAVESNQANLEQVQGLTGRTFNRILGAADGDKSTGDQSFGHAELSNYMEKQLEFAKGEWFSGTKVSGAADGVLEQLDKNGDGRVGWEEFQAFRSNMLQVLAPGVSEGACAAEIEASASEAFIALQAKGADFEGIESSNLANIKPETDHRELMAQLGALLLLDAVDLNEQSVKPKDRTLDQTEWMSAANDFGGIE